MTNRFIGPAGSGSTFSRGTPGHTAGAIAASSPGDTITALSGTYTGDNYMITLIFGVSGSPGNPITIVADVDGAAYFDGEDDRVPVTVSDSWWNIIGVNCAHSLHDVVLMAGSHVNFYRCGFWDANVSENAYVISTFYPSDTVLFEDCFGFGTGRKIMGATAGALSTTFRRCFAMWNGSVSTAGPKQVFTIAYDSYGCIAENCIGTRDEDIDPGEGDSIGIFSMDRMTENDYDCHSIYNGCLGFYLATQVVRESPNGILPLGSSMDYFEWKDCAIFLGAGHDDITLINAPPFNGNGGGAGQPFQTDASGGNRKYTNITCVGNGRADTVDTSSPNGATITNMNQAASVALAYPGMSLWINDGAHGATIRFEIVNGVTGTTPLFPWKMNQRIIDGLTANGRTPIDITATMVAIWGPNPDMGSGSALVDNFDSYTPGDDLNTKNAATHNTTPWTKSGEGGAGAMTIQVAPSLTGAQGGNAVRSQSAAGATTYYYIGCEARSVGSQTFEQSTTITNPNHAQYGASMHEFGVGKRCEVHFGTGGFIEAYDGTTSSWVHVAAYVANTVYRFEIAWDNAAHPSQYRVRVNEGSFTSWIGTTGTLTVLNMFQINDFASNGHILWTDAVGSTVIPVIPGLSQLLLDKVLKNTAFLVAPLWLSLHTGPTGLTGEREVTGGSYARFPASEDYWSTPAARSITNVMDMQFPPMPATTVAYAGLWSAEVGGTFIRGVPLSYPVPLSVGNTPIFRTGQVTFALTSDFSTYLANKILDYLFRANDFTSAPAYWALHKGAKDDSGGNEVTGGSYARQIATIAHWQGTGVSILGDTLFSLDYQFLVTFASMPAVLLTRLALWDASTSGHFLMWGPNEALAVTAGQNVTIDGTIAGNLSATLTQTP